MRSNRLQLNTAKTEVLCIQSTPPSATSVVNWSGHRSNQASFLCAQPWYPHRRRCFDEVACHRLSLPVSRSCVSCEAFIIQCHAPFYSHWCRLSSCSGWTTVTQRCSAHLSPDQADAVGDEFCCSACILHRRRTASLCSSHSCIG